MTSLLIFGCNVVLDILAVLFLRYCSEGKRIRAGIISVLIVAISYVSIIYIVEVSGWLIVPACAGAFCGTVITVKRRK